MSAKVDGGQALLALMWSQQQMENRKMMGAMGFQESRNKGVVGLSPLQA